MKPNDYYFLRTNLFKRVKILTVGVDDALIVDRNKHKSDYPQPFRVLKRMLVTLDERDRLVARDKKYKSKAAAWKRTNKLNGR